MVSIDALKPEFLFEQERLGISLPFLTSYFLKGGRVAPKGMKSVFPPFTYPCHQSMITGTNPVTHGIVNNAVFDPSSRHKGAWHWFANKRVTTLWEAAHQAGYVVGSAAFPTSVGAKGDYVAPEFWWDGTEMDSAFIDAVSKPQGLIAEMEADIGRYAGGLDLSDDGDAQRYKAAAWLLRNKLGPCQAEKPFFLTAYFASFDESAHQSAYTARKRPAAWKRSTPWSACWFAKPKPLRVAASSSGVVSDHGTLDNTHTVYPNVLLRQAGLIECDDTGCITDWKAYSQRAGGICEIRLARKDDEASRKILDGVMRELAQDGRNAIMAVLTGEEARARGGFPDADYVLISHKGTKYGTTRTASLSVRS